MLRYFSHLLRCGLAPVLVFDGGADKTEAKEQTQVKRMTEATENAVICNSVNQSKLGVFPAFTTQVLSPVPVPRSDGTRPQCRCSWRRCGSWG